MESGVADRRLESQSSGQISARSGRWRAGSLSFSRVAVDLDLQLQEDIQSEIIARAGDAGDLSLSEEGRGGSCRSLSFDIDAMRSAESGVLRLPDDALVHINGFWFNGGSTEDANRSPVSPLQCEIVSPVSSEPIICSRDRSDGKSQEQSAQVQDNQKFLLYASCLVYLAVFGILGVFLRYLLQKLFGQGTIGWTADNSTVYLDLPSNMVGSFLMGWLGIIYKGDISRFSELLAIGLTTGFLGSLTTFSGWNQKMLELALKGKWPLVVIGFSVDMLLVAACISVGVTTAKGLQRLFKCLGSSNRSDHKMNYKMFQTTMLFILIFLLCFLWGLGVALFKKGIEAHETSAQLWLAIVVGPPGVWLRWFLAGYNGRGFGRARSMKWVPFGTLAANVLAATIMAGLATIKKVVSTKRCDIIIGGIQLGFLGCLSTVSTFVAEIYAMNQSSHPWRAYAYALATILLSFILGTLVYSVPVWAKKYQ